MATDYAAHQLAKKAVRPGEGVAVIDGRIVSPGDGSKDLAKCTAKIHAANDKQRKSFVQWVQVVGEQLRAGQELLASRKAGKKDGFEKWCREEFGWSPQHSRRLVDASDTLRLIEPIGSVKALPSSESQCRELAHVPEDELPQVWQEIVTESQEQKKPITAKLIRQHVERFKDADAPEREAKPKEFDDRAATDRLCDLLRAELRKWPEGKQATFAHWVKHILKENGLWT